MVGSAAASPISTPSRPPLREAVCPRVTWVEAPLSSVVLALGSLLSEAAPDAWAWVELECGCILAS